MLNLLKGLNGLKMCSSDYKKRKSDQLKTKPHPMNSIFHGFGPAAIFLIVLTFAANQFYLFLKHRQQKKF